MTAKGFMGIFFAVSKEEIKGSTGRPTSPLVLLRLGSHGLAFALGLRKKVEAYVSESFLLYALHPP
jgi:hypothetical protein